MDHLKSEARISKLDINGNNDDDRNLHPKSAINSVNFTRCFYNEF